MMMIVLECKQHVRIEIVTELNFDKYVFYTSFLKNAVEYEKVLCNKQMTYTCPFRKHK